jgi:hypothetical protein
VDIVHAALKADAAHQVRAVGVIGVESVVMNMPDLSMLHGHPQGLSHSRVTCRHY